MSIVMNDEGLIALLRREGQYGGVWFGPRLLDAADRLEALATPSQRLDAATVEREWSLPDLRDLHTDVERIRDHDLGNKRMRDLLRAAMDALIAADAEYAALANEPHQHGGEGA